MAFLRANTTPASAPGGHVWADAKTVLEIPDDLANELLHIAGQFCEVLPGDPDHPASKPKRAAVKTPVEE